MYSKWQGGSWAAYTTLFFAKISANMGEPKVLQKIIKLWSGVLLPTLKNSGTVNSDHKREKSEMASVPPHLLLLTFLHSCAVSHNVQQHPKEMNILKLARHLYLLPCSCHLFSFLHDVDAVALESLQSGALNKWIFITLRAICCKHSSVLYQSEEILSKGSRTVPA